MATDTHIKFDGVEGESTHESHKGEIEVRNWDWRVTNDANLIGGGQGKGKATPGVLTFTHTYDKASPVLAKKAAQGAHFDTVVLTARKSGDGQKDFLKFTLREAFVTRVATSGSQGGEILETVDISYAEVEAGYKPQDAKGTVGGEVKFLWNNKTTKIS